MSAVADLSGVERGEIVVDSGRAYGDGEPVEVLVRKRLHRYLLTDRRRAVEKAGKPIGWREVAEQVVLPMNIDRQGTVFVPGRCGARPRGPRRPPRGREPGRARGVAGPRRARLVALCGL